jgi:hypothetical protein
MADDAWVPTVVLHDRGDLGGPCAPPSHVVDYLRQVGPDSATLEIDRELERRRALFDGTSNGRADR